MTMLNQIDLVKLHAAAGEACKLLKVLSNPDRMLLLCQMTRGEFSVKEMETITGVLQPMLSQQLTVLRKERLVSTRREGKQIFYSISSNEALEVLQVLYKLYCPTD